MNLGAHLFPAAGAHIRNVMASLGLDVVSIPGNKSALWFAGRVYSPKSSKTFPLVLPMTIRERLSFARIGVVLLKAVRGWQKAMRPVYGESEPARRARVAKYMADISFRDLIKRPPERVDTIFRSIGRRAAAEVENQSAGVGVSVFGAVWSGKGTSLALNVRGGSGKLGEAMTEALGKRVEFNAKAKEVSKDGDAIRVSYEKAGQTYSATASEVIVAIPAFMAADAVKDIPEAVRATLRTVQYGPFLSMGIITNETEAMPWDRIYAILTPDASFNMLFNHANPLRTGGKRNPGGSLMVYAGGKLAAELMKLSDDEIREKYLNDLYKIYPQLKSIIKETVVHRWSPGLTCRPAGFNFDAILEYCERADTDIHFAGDYFAELGTMEVAAGSAHEAARRARVRLLAMDRIAQAAIS